MIRFIIFIALTSTFSFAYPQGNVFFKPDTLKYQKIRIEHVDPVVLSNGGFINYMSPKTEVHTCGMFTLVSHKTTAKDLEAQFTRNLANIKTGYGYYHPSGIHTFNQQQINALPQRNINSVAGIVAGVDSRNGQTPNIKGARADGTAYFIDGIRINENIMY